jgi:hypothetical protein
VTRGGEGGCELRRLLEYIAKLLLTGLLAGKGLPRISILLSSNS